MNKQEVFDKVVNHLRTQGEKCLASVGGVCRYRNEQGLKCAIGALISDEEYQGWMEGGRVDDIVDDTRLPKSLFWMKDDVVFLHMLQAVHDTVPVDKWEDKLKYISKRFFLIYTPPKG